MSLSVRASERTSSGPSSAASGERRSSAPLTRAAPARRRASGRSVRLANSHAASPVSARARTPIAATSRRVVATRSRTGVSVCATSTRSSPSVWVSARQGSPSIVTVDSPSPAGSAGGSLGTSPWAVDDRAAVGDLGERAAAHEQALRSVTAEPVVVVVGRPAADLLYPLGELGVDGGAPSRPQHPADAADRVQDAGFAACLELAA
jgi:hypothetical protein